MSRLAMNKAGSPAKAPADAAVAVLHAQEGRVRLLIARQRDRWEVIESRTLPNLEGAALQALFAQHDVQRIVRIAPGRETMARCVSVPAGDDSAMASAAALMAEAELPAALPSYRRAGGVLPESGPAEMRTALLTGWMQAGRAPEPVMEKSDAWPEVWVAPIAALALLRGESGRAAVYCEGAEGLICLLVPGAERAVARVLVEKPGSGEAWSARVAKAVEETAQMAGVPASSAQAFNANIRLGSQSRLLMEAGSVSALKARVSGIREDNNWLDDFGMAVGAVLVAGSGQASVRGLASLHAETPREQLSLVEAGTQWLSRPRHAWAVVTAALALMLLVPMGLACGRLALLERRTAPLKDLKVGREGLEKRAAMYSQLEGSRWPMTKLMADIAAATPVGVKLTNMQLTAGQAVTLSGTAESAEMVTKLQSSLAATHVFSNIRINRQDAKGGSLDFEITGRVTANAHVPVKVTEENDFTSKPLAVRLYGEGASNTAAPAHDGGHEDAPRRRGRGETRASSGDSGEKAAAGESRRPGSGGKSDAVPPPLSDADIAKLDRNKAMMEWVGRQTYTREHPTLDAATKQRLLDESKKAKEQMEKLKNETKGAPAGGGS